ncbi:MAG: hypothetical protein JXR66_05945 [Bacteroidales bacterium]|nr:hypothetical protein [Bacteroidales bacterium]MBN2633076.1 hypothetical protein [Bacteroidales bacterium]
MKNKGEILASILREYNYCYFFLHNTKEFRVVEKIMNEGFIFENQLPHSTDRVNPNEPIEITYFLFQRKEYGHYTVVIAIPKEIYEKYTELSETFNTGIEEVMTISDPYVGENDELMYVISPGHVMGYFSIKNSEFIFNPAWDRDYDNSLYRKPAKRTIRPDIK